MAVRSGGIDGIGGEGAAETPLGGGCHRGDRRVAEIMSQVLSPEGPIRDAGGTDYVVRPAQSGPGCTLRAIRVCPRPRPPTAGKCPIFSPREGMSRAAGAGDRARSEPLGHPWPSGGRCRERLTRPPAPPTQRLRVRRAGGGPGPANLAELRPPAAGRLPARESAPGAAHGVLAGAAHWPLVGAATVVTGLAADTALTARGALPAAAVLAARCRSARTARSLRREPATQAVTLRLADGTVAKLSVPIAALLEGAVTVGTARLVQVGVATEALGEEARDDAGLVGRAARAVDALAAAEPGGRATAFLVLTQGIGGHATLTVGAREAAGAALAVL